jgi:DNA-binding NarL/FixJ family response regulator
MASLFVTVMMSSTRPPRASSLAALTSEPDYASRMLAELPALDAAESPELAIRVFERAIEGLGGDAGVFTSCLHDDSTTVSYRSLLACDPDWGTEYARREWFACDPWLRHALHDSEPVRSRELILESADEQAFVDASASLGFVSALIAPAPTSVGSSRVGVLCIGSSRPDFFDDEGYAVVRVLARALSMELNRWMLQSTRREQLERWHLSQLDIDLLRHEVLGHGSKYIGASLGVRPITIDARFQRICAKLEVPNRRTAARIARLYGVI